MTRDSDDDFFSDPFGRESLHFPSSSTFSRHQNSFSTSSSGSDGGFGFPKRFFDSDRDLNSNAGRSHHLIRTRRMNVDSDDDDNKTTFTKTVAIGRDVNPDDVKITLKEYVMTVEVKTAGHEFMNRFTIPKNVDKSKLNSTWTDEGNLKIEAPLIIEEKQQQRKQQSSQVERKFFDTDSSDFFGSGIEQSQNTPGKFSMTVPLGRNVDPQNLKVTVKDDLMTIEAKMEKKTGDATSVQEFKKKFTLPSNVDTKELTSTLTTDRHLKIEAPVLNQKQRQ